MASAAILTLDQLVDDNDGFDLGGSKQKSDKPFFDLETAYHVEITEILAKTTKAGYLQAEVAIKFVDGDIKAGRQWIMLPVFTKEMQSSLDNIKLAELKESFGKKLQSFLRAVSPEQYAVYSRVDKSNKKWRYFDANDQEMTWSEKQAREKAVSKYVVDFAKDLVTGQDVSELIGNQVYLVMTPNKTKPEYPWVNWYSEQPSKYPLAETTADGDTPF